MSTPEDEKTRMVRRPSNPPRNAQPPQLPSDNESTLYVQINAGMPPQDGTRIIDREREGFVRESPNPAAPPVPAAEGRTVLVRPSSRAQRASTQTTDSALTEDFPPEGPVVGWVVVLQGPGRGRAVPLGYGMNTLGRDPDNRVCLPFEDEQISRKKHAVITYDPRGRKFYIQHGESSNLTYLGEVPVLAPAMLQGGETIRLGDRTVLRFVRLCGDDFSWEAI